MTQGNHGRRAACALDAVLPPRGRIKTVQRLFDVSGRMARYLLAGDRWTARRLTQASEILGDAFDAAFHRPASAWTHIHEMHEIKTRIARLEQDIEMARREAARMAPDQSVSAYLDGRAHQEKEPSGPE